MRSPAVVFEVGHNNHVGRLGRNKSKICMVEAFHSPRSYPSVETYERLLLITRAENIQLASAERIPGLSGCRALQFCRSEVYLKSLA